MPIKNGFYDVYTDDSLSPGAEINIDHAIVVDKDKVDISDLVPLPVSELERRQAESVRLENVIFEQLCAAVSKWEEQAAITSLLNRAIAYCKTPACQHTNNQWAADEHGNNVRSNMTYVMRWRVYEETRYDNELDKSVPHAWHLTWSVFTNSRIEENGWKTTCSIIAGQNGKRFTEMATMEKYLKGIIVAYDHLFNEISPPVPRRYADHFIVNGQLLPGYTIAEDKTEKPERLPKWAQEKLEVLLKPAEKESVVDKIRQSRQTETPENPASKKDKKVEPEH